MNAVAAAGVMTEANVFFFGPIDRGGGRRSYVCSRLSSREISPSILWPVMTMAFTRLCPDDASSSFGSIPVPVSVSGSLYLRPIRPSVDTGTRTENRAGRCSDSWH